MTAAAAVSGAGGWGGVLRVRHAARLLLGTTVARLPQCMAPIVLVLAVRAESGSWAWGSTLASTFCICLAVGHLVLGRVTDRIGQTLPTIGGALVAAMAYTMLTLPGIPTTPAGLVLAALAGLATPPTEASTRALWQTMVAPGMLRAAYSVDNAVQESAHVAAPLLVPLSIAVGGPRFTLAVMALTGVLGALVVAMSPPSRHWQPHQRSDQRLLGALAPAGMRALQLLLALVGVTVGGVYVGATVAAEQLHAGWLAGVMPAALSVGAMAGCGLYGARPWRGGVATHLVVGCAVFAVLWLPLLVASTPVWMVAATGVAGMLFGPLHVIGAQAITLLAPPGCVTEAQAWLVASVGLGMAGGSALAGRADGPVGFVPLVAAVFALVMGVLVAPLLRRATPSAGKDEQAAGAGRLVDSSTTDFPDAAAPMAGARRATEGSRVPPGPSNGRADRPSLVRSARLPSQRAERFGETRWS